MGGRGRESPARGHDVLGIVLLRLAGARRLHFGDLEGVTLLQAVGMLSRAGGVVVEGRRGGDALCLVGYMQGGRAIVGLGHGRQGRGWRRRRRSIGTRIGADGRDVKVSARLSGAVGCTELAHFDVGGAATEAVLGLAAVYRGKVAVVSARPLARLVLLCSPAVHGLVGAIRGRVAALACSRRSLCVCKGEAVGRVGAIRGHHLRLMDGHAHQRGSLPRAQRRRGRRSVGSQCMCGVVAWEGGEGGRGWW